MAPPSLRKAKRGGHSSGTDVATRLMQPTRTTGPDTALEVSLRAVPIRFCSRWGLPCRPCCQARGGLLPHPFTLAPPAHRPRCANGPICRRGGLLSVALSLGSPPPEIIRHRVSVEPGLSSPPACAEGAAARPADGAYKGVRRAKRNVFRAAGRLVPETTSAERFSPASSRSESSSGFRTGRAGA
jgi:hypothetical protein